MSPGDDAPQPPGVVGRHRAPRPGEDGSPITAPAPRVAALAAPEHRDAGESVAVTAPAEPPAGPTPPPAPWPDPQPAQPGFPDETTVTGPTVSTEARLLRRLLGDATLELDATRRARLLGWLGPLLVTALAALARFPNLGRPHRLVFDETYYVKQAYTLLKVGYEAAWPKDANKAFEAGNLDTFLPRADYAVHPPVGKWLIALGMEVTGPASSFGWRLSAAVCGTLAVLMLARIARRLFASTVLGTIAGGLLAVDGEAIVASRTGLLDGFVMFFALAAFGAILLDRDHARRRLARRMADRLDSGRDGTGWGPRLGVRWWRLAAAVLLGLTIGTKWSGLYFLAVFALLSVLWDIGARRAVGIRFWWAGGIARDGLPAVVTMLPLAALTYVASWFSWFRTPGAYLRDWAATHPGEGVGWLPEALRSLWHYHLEMWQFHNNLAAPHAYAAHAAGWLIQWRPTSFFYQAPVPAGSACGSDRCSQAVTSLGNPIIWWAATIAVVAVVWWLVRDRDWRAAAVLSGLVAGWLPWFAYPHRTIFTFYSIAFTPWVVLVLTYALGRVRGPTDASEVRRRRGAVWLTGFLVLVAVISVFFYPIWTAQVVPFTFWRLHMWLLSWV